MSIAILGARLARPVFRLLGDSVRWFTMNLHPAAALALVGWYLMLPPMNEKGVFTQASMSDWDQVGSFDSAVACEQAVQQGQHAIAVMGDQEFKQHSQREAAQNGKMAISRADALKRAYAGECIATDDPRLKEKSRSRRSYGFSR